MRVKKDYQLIIFLILIPIFMFGAFYISSRIGNSLPQFSIENKSNEGCSIFYETLKNLKLPVDRSISTVEIQDINSIQIVVPGGSFDINSSKIKNWVYNGGVLVSLSSGNIHILDYGLLPKIKGGMNIYSYGKGTIIGADINAITNKTLLSNTDGAYELLAEMGSYNKAKIYFNESYLFSQNNNMSLWDYMPLWSKFIVYQLIIALIAFFYYKGKRFGRPLPFYEETERSENEYLHSAAALYRQAKGYDLILENFYKKLLKELNSNHEDWLKLWESKSLPSLKEARRFKEFMDINKKRKPKEYIKAIAIVEHLINIIEQRRESYWKILKIIK
ncbi:hypothetical protein [Candidatus Clostridium stratigraminis]|uniref:DUF4350 domain-containing protein n=1 Tax=Candidatus Clostridium stratigraminis TaxID=3381661 RepID=A0ABW8TBQ5_9CLOT